MESAITEARAWAAAQTVTEECTSISPHIPARPVGLCSVGEMVSKPAEWPAFEILLEEMEKCRRMFQAFSLTHIPRSQNTKADKLARSARAQPHNVYYINSIPPTSLPEPL
ncbi:unnamed protein product [Microthlaspi erraticum]|uniref:RNase H type-1 domain-containing protein n=1 Tax=Microthlaspi erraticum TaxID=1685480 RepID=A0A6D2JLH4_9BRAS|nr:unnamed protein product [Microthlaspi erraticum]